MEYSIHKLNNEVINCSLCPRLSNYLKSVGTTKIRRFRNDTYWAKPVPGFGDPAANLLIIGLAPAAHGGNRTGRMFTGDNSGLWLIRALNETGFANIPTSLSIDDGLILKNTYVTSCVKCAPPKNIPHLSEIRNCSRHLENELVILDKNLKVIITLGKLAFDTLCSIYNVKKLRFFHGSHYDIGNKHLLVSYHPSQQNTFTKKLRWEMWIKIFETAKEIIYTNF